MMIREKSDNLFNEIVNMPLDFSWMIEMAKEIDYRNKFGYFLMTDEQIEKMTPVEKHVYYMFHPDIDK